MSRGEYRPEIDGLRAVAVLLVLLYHAGFGFSGGFVGVDVFFVISGFLITGLILREQTLGTFSLSAFWIRRIRRILPASTCMVAATLGVGACLLLPNDFSWLAESAFAQQLLFSNVYFWASGGYFDGPAELKPLLHTWSLAVEEQFYLLFPLLLVIFRRWPRRRLAFLLCGLALVSLMASEYAARRSPTAGFYLLPTRAWELLIGSLLTFIPAPTWLKAWQRNLLGAVGLIAIVASSWFYSSLTPFPGVAALSPCLGAALFIYSSTQAPTLIARIMSLKPIVFIGLISYSLYLWHWPLFAFLKYYFERNVPLDVRAAAMLASIAIAYVSWTLIEKPTRYGTWFQSGRVLVPTAAGSALTLILASVAIVWFDGLPYRFSIPIMGTTNVPSSLFLPGLRKGVVPPNVECIGATKEWRSPVSFVLWGDSHAQSVSDLCGTLAEVRGLRGIRAARPGFVPLLGVAFPDLGESVEEQLKWNEEIVDFVVRESVPHVILVGRWEARLAGGAKEGGLIRDSKTVNPSIADSKRVFREGLTKTVKRLAAAGAKVWLLKQVPVQDGNPVLRLSRAVAGDSTEISLRQGVSRNQYQEQQRNVEDVFTTCQIPGLSFLGPGDNWFDDQGFSRIVSGEHSFYRDADHLTGFGADELFRPLLEPVFDEMALNQRTP